MGIFHYFKLLVSGVKISSRPRSGPGLASLIGNETHTPIGARPGGQISTTASWGFLIYRTGPNRGACSFPTGARSGSFKI